MVKPPALPSLRPSPLILHYYYFSNMLNNYTPPVYAVHDKLTKLASAAGCGNSNNGGSVSAANSIDAISSHAPVHESINAKGSAYSSLLCYQSATPPSPPSSLCTPKHAQRVITSSMLVEKLGQHQLDQEPAAVKKRTKLRHRFSDVGSWGRKKKERNPKYHSIHIETLEVLGEPVVEDEFFVSVLFLLFFFW